MIHEIGRELEAALLARGCPFKVVDGPEATQPVTYRDSRIVIERDEDAGDSFTTPKSQSINPRMYAVRNIGVKLTIYAQSVAAGAAPFEHRRRAEHALDMVVVALIDIAAARKNAMRITGGRLVQPIDLEKSEAVAGAVYELKLTWERGITQKTWAGAIRPEFEITADNLTSTTLVSRAFGPDDDNDPSTPPAIAEVACGA